SCLAMMLTIVSLADSASENFVKLLSFPIELDRLTNEDAIACGGVRRTNRARGGAAATVRYDQRQRGCHQGWCASAGAIFATAQGRICCIDASCWWSLGVTARWSARWNSRSHVGLQL